MHANDWRRCTHGAQQPHLRGRCTRTKYKGAQLVCCTYTTVIHRESLERRWACININSSRGGLVGALRKCDWSLAHRVFVLCQYWLDAGDVCVKRRPLQFWFAESFLFVAIKSVLPSNFPPMGRYNTFCFRLVAKTSFLAKFDCWERNFRGFPLGDIFGGETVDRWKEIQTQLKFSLFTKAVLFQFMTFIYIFMINCYKDQR